MDSATPPEPERHVPASARRGWLPSRGQAVAAVVIALALLMVNDSFFFESILVPTGSMQPTVLPNERAFLRKFPGRAIHRFDVVVIKGRSTHQRIVKRVIGLPGDRVRLENSWKVYINGRPLRYMTEGGQPWEMEEEDHAIAVSPGAAPRFEMRFGETNLLLGPGEYFVLGDNRLESRDSRVIGPIQRGEIEGTLCRVWYSYDLSQNRLRTERLMQAVK